MSFEITLPTSVKIIINNLLIAFCCPRIMCVRCDIFSRSFFTRSSFNRRWSIIQFLSSLLFLPCTDKKQFLALFVEGWCYDVGVESFMKLNCVCALCLSFTFMLARNCFLIRNFSRKTNEISIYGIFFCFQEEQNSGQGSCPCMIFKECS